MPSPPRAVCDGIRTSLHTESRQISLTVAIKGVVQATGISQATETTHTTPLSWGETALLQSPKCGRILPKGKRRVFCLGRHCLFAIRLSPGPSYTLHHPCILHSVLPAHFWAILLCLQHHGVSEAGLLVIPHNNLRRDLCRKAWVALTFLKYT